MEECIFCRLIQDGSLSKLIIDQDDEFIVFLDSTPLTRGHTLVIPRKHIKYLWEFDNIPGIIMKAKEIADRLKGALGADKIDLLVSGGSVPHLHLHLLPDTKSGAWEEIQSFWRKRRGQLSSDETKVNPELIKTLRVK